uniref:Cation-transporting P-type ATPase C-terminal domain-containing protein n=1 Tax=Vitis vinifera TaxID=29760 RepID=A5BRG7_VITVI|nr:hypothetical protein VITISV_043492 [Vitis vinifera]
MNKIQHMRQASFITRIRQVMVFCNLTHLAQAVYQIAILLTLQFKGESFFNVDEKVKDMLVFNTFVLCQVFNEFNARKMEKQNVFKGIHKNKLFLGMVRFIIVLQVVMVEFLKKFADAVNLNGSQWAICIALAAVSWPIGWIVKFIPVSDKPFLDYLFRYENFLGQEGRHISNPPIRPPSFYPSPRILAQIGPNRKPKSPSKRIPSLLVMEHGFCGI